MVKARSEAGFTTTDAVLLLLPTTGSISLVEPNATVVASKVPELPGMTLMAAVARVRGAILPKLQTTVLPEIVKVPCEGVTDVIPTVGGRVLLATTLVAGLGPLLVTETV